MITKSASAKNTITVPASGSERAAGDALTAFDPAGLRQTKQRGNQAVPERKLLAVSRNGSVT